MAGNNHEKKPIMHITLIIAIIIIKHYNNLWFKTAITRINHWTLHVQPTLSKSYPCKIFKIETFCVYVTKISVARGT
jgi:hypothetical protein